SFPTRRSSDLVRKLPSPSAFGGATFLRTSVRDRAASWHELLPSPRRCRLALNRIAESCRAPHRHTQVSEKRLNISHPTHNCVRDHVLDAPVLKLYLGLGLFSPRRLDLDEGNNALVDEQDVSSTLEHPHALCLSACNGGSWVVRDMQDNRTGDRNAEPVYDGSVRLELGGVGDDAHAASPPKRLSCLGCSAFVASTNISGWAYALRMRSTAISKYEGSRSMPINLRPALTHATPVVPEPMKGSRMVLALGMWVRHHDMSATGFCVGWCRSMPCSAPRRKPAHSWRNMRIAP